MSRGHVEWAPWERGVNRTAVPPLPTPSGDRRLARGGDVAVPAARTAAPVNPGDEKPATRATAAPGRARDDHSRPRSDVGHAGNVDAPAPASTTAEPVEPATTEAPPSTVEATRAHAEPAPAGPADEAPIDQPRWSGLRPTGPRPRHPRPPAPAPVESTPVESTPADPTPAVENPDRRRPRPLW